VPHDAQERGDHPSVAGRLIEDYLLGLRRRLTGPDGLKEELLGELRDALTDASQAYRHAGYGGHEAQRRAVTDFGHPDVIASEIQNELDIVQGRTTALHASVGLPLLLLLWYLVHWARPWPTIDPAWAHIISALGYGAGIVNLIALAGVWYVRLVVDRRTQPFERPSRSRKLLGAFILAALGAYGTAMTLIASATAVVSWKLLLAPAVAAATVMSLVLCALLASSARRCLTHPH
jgi:hypothetical protein